MALLDLQPYRNPALHFSGGKDSLACLYLLREQLEQVTVYWLDTGDSCPETLEVIAEVLAWIPRFVRVKSDVNTWREKHGFPSDLVPASGHLLGAFYELAPIKVSNRFDCCWHNLMAPLHARMLEDGVDAVIRGTKLADTGQVPAEGQSKPYSVLLPLLHWTHSDVFAYLQRVKAPVNKLYSYYKGASAPECLNCTAWWDDGKARYLQAEHPLQFVKYKKRLQEIQTTIAEHLTHLSAELGVVNGG